MTPAPVHREFVADAAGVAELDDWLEAATRAWPFQGSVLKARVCAAELAANLMEHDAEPGRRARLQVRLSAEEDGVALELVDDGRAFDPTRPAAAGGETLQAATPGGRGLRTVQGLARTLEYRREDARNRLLLRIGETAKGGA